MFAQLVQILGIQVIQGHEGVLRILRGPNQFVEFQVQDVVIAILCVLDEEHHQEGDDRCGGVDDQLPGVVVIEVRPC